MAYVFSDQQSFLSTLLGDSNVDSSSMFGTTQRQREINNGEIQFAVDGRHLREYATGTVASKQIAVPSDWLGTYVLTVNNKVITNDREISLTDWERYQDWGGDDPYYYFWEFSGTRYIKLLGSSNVNTYTYQLFYWKRPTTLLSSDSDTSIHPEEYRKAPVYYAASELMKQIAKYDQADKFYQSYAEYVAKANYFVEKTFINKEYARPDFGDVDQSTTDVQGQGYIW